MTYKSIRLSSFNAKLICILFAIFLLLLLEIASRLLFPPDRLDNIVFILKRDPQLFWCQRSNLNINFQGVRVKTDNFGLRNENNPLLNKPKDSLRIICLGASPTFGWGVRYEDTYPYLLEKSLLNKTNKKVEIINAGIIGYSSYQGIRFFKKNILKLQPDIITVSYVLNDIDKYRFFRNNGQVDKELKDESPVFIMLYNFFSNFRFFQLFDKLTFYLTTKFNSGGKNGVYYSNTRRVSPEDYQNNLQAIIDLASKNRIKVILIKMPVNLPNFRNIPSADLGKAASLLSSGIAYFKSADYDKAIMQMNASLGYNSYSSQAFYYLALSFKKKGNPVKFKEYVDKAKANEAYECGEAGLLYNSIMEETAKTYHVPLVDIVSAFNEIKNEYLFISPTHDSIHPNALGHKIIAYQIYNTLIKNKLLPGYNGN